MRLVVDTNVFISAALKQTSSPAMVLRWLDRYGGLLKTRETEREVMEVLLRPRIAPKVSPVFTDNLRRMFVTADLVTVIEPIIGCRDRDDDKFLELAVNGHADALVSGDADLLVLGSFRGIPIITPTAFLNARTP